MSDAEDRRQIGSERLADTVIPWTSEWLWFSELWLATGGEWRGGGVHPNGGAAPLTEVEKGKGRIERKERLLRLTNGLRAFYDAEQIDDLLHNARL